MALLRGWHFSGWHKARPYCNHLLGDGVCHDESNVGECGFDHGDCCLSLPGHTDWSQCPENGVITSPGFPHIYDKNLERMWIIFLSSVQSIEIEFVSFDVGYSWTCNDVGSDFLKLYGGEPGWNAIGNTDEEYLIGKYCGQDIPPSYFSPSNSVVLHFKSHHIFQRTGFKLKYHSN